MKIFKGVLAFIAVSVVCSLAYDALGYPELSFWPQFIIGLRCVAQYEIIQDLMKQIK